MEERVQFLGPKGEKVSFPVISHNEYAEMRRSIIPEQFTTEVQHKTMGRYGIGLVRKWKRVVYPSFSEKDGLTIAFSDPKRKHLGIRGIHGDDIDPSIKQVFDQKARRYMFGVGAIAFAGTALQLFAQRYHQMK